MFSEAFAQTAGGGAGGMDFAGILPLVLIFVVFYFLLIRPQQKRMKEHKNLVANLRRGDTVVTSGGLVGKIDKVEENEVIVQIAEGVKVTVIRSTIADIRGKTEPADTKK
ncbi:MAG: preprotein translocase subunit YajC [Kordiimonas sp.]|nr:preprotein translocase subunit YajC [Kordiimonas sp.]|tara:strand:+ start:2785 stop:3114 length:330 start_codon:yes stop_codon:yes gene_type:complete